jgi:hypothetical protein
VTPRPFPPASPHGELREIFSGLYFVTGSVVFPGPLRVRFSRNMTVVREGERLVLINSVRLNDAGLKQLDALGRVTDVIRLAGFHGADDPFYKDRYGAKIWVIKGQRYTAGFDGKSAPYLEPDAELGAGSELPLAGARLYVFSTEPAEALLLLAREGGVLVSGDCLQHWAEPDPYISWTGSLMLKLFGFMKPHNVGPAWLKRTKPPASELRAVLDLDFDHVLPAHGAPVLGGAKAAYRAALEKAAATRVA